MKNSLYSDEYFLQKCLREVEEKLGWGSSDSWTQTDFQELSEKIAESTGVLLSITTIKRLWGKVKYEGNPSNATLNSLALFLGYEHWRDFKLKNAPVSEHRESPSVYPADNHHHNRSVFSRFAKPGIALLLLLVVSALVLYFSNKTVSRSFKASNVRFDCEPVTTGLPNTVVFNYDISYLDVDSAFIQQSWDPSRRTRIDKNNKQSTSIYYYPGYFKAKLILNDTIIKEHDVFIPTNGWIGIVNTEPIPTYFDLPAITTKDLLHLEPGILAQRNIKAENGEFWTSYHNTRRFNVPSDSFSLECKLKNNLRQGAFTCQDVYIILTCEKSVFFFPLMDLGCISNAAARFSDFYIDGKSVDMSAFGADLSDWNSVKCTSSNRNVEIMVNQKPVYALHYREDAGKIVGLTFRFRGSGWLDEIRLKDGKENVVYEDLF